MPPLKIIDTNDVTRVILGDISTAEDESSFGLKVIAADGSTTIIDGTSDVFKIIATGTMFQAIFASPAAAVTNVTVATGLTYSPVAMGFLQSGIQSFPIPMARRSGATNTFYQVFSQVVLTNQTEVDIVTDTTFAGTSGGETFRYYIMQETGF